MSDNLDPSQQAAREQFGRQSAEYGRKHILRSTEDLEAALPAFQIEPGQSLLDVGCGAGHTGLFFARRGLAVTLSDLTPEMLDQSRALLEGIPAQYACHPAESMPWPEENFDRATCRVAAHHFSDPEAFLRETARVLKPSGRFLLIDGAVQDGFPVAAEWLHNVEKLRDPSHGRFHSPATWEEFCKQAGLTVVEQQLLPLRQPDLNWYFETAGTSPENRSKVLEQIRNAPAEAVELFELDASGPISWTWQRLLLVAMKPEG